MEKQIKMSLELAREFYKDATEITKKWLLENFTKEELECKKGFTWEDSFSGNGYWIDKNSNIHKLRTVGGFAEDHKNIFLTEAHAKSALAFAQLSHIVAKYNEGKEIAHSHYTINNLRNKLEVLNFESIKHTLLFSAEEDAITSLEVNRELWEQYHMIEKQ